MIRALATAALGVALALSAAAFDAVSLYVPGIALGTIGAAAAVWVRLAAYGARVVRAPGPATVVEEEPYPLRIEVRAGLVPPPGGELIEPLLGWPVPIAGRWSRRLRINVRFERRGRRALAPGRLVIRDPLALAVREVSGEAGGHLLVLPRIEPVQAAGGGAGGGRGADGLSGSDGATPGRLGGAAAELELDSLRPYRPGSPASRIHWPAVARTGTMLERNLVADAESRPLVVLDPRAAPASEQLDRAVRAAASLCVHIARGGGCGLLLPGDRRPTQIAPDLAAWPALHARLALMESGERGPALAGVPRHGAVFWVAAGGSGTVPRELGRTAAAVYVVTPEPLDGVAAFSVAGCNGYPRTRARPRGRRRVAARRAA